MMWLSSFILGAVFGSFLNVLIYRLKNGGNVIFDRSRCPNCRAVLKWQELIPLISFFWLRGHCRNCRKKISWRYPIVELLSGLIWILVFYKIFSGEFTFESLTKLGDFFYCLFIFSVFLAIAVYDFNWKTIPDRIIYPALAFILAYRVSVAVVSRDFLGNVLYPLVAALAAFILFFFIYYFSKGRAMGFGDAKLAFLIGISLSPILAFAALNLAFITGALCGIILLIFGKKSLKSQIAFGPFMVFGAFVSFLFDFLVYKLFFLI